VAVSFSAIAEVCEFLAATGGEIQDCSRKVVEGTNVRELHPLPTVGVHAHPPRAKSSLAVYAAAGVVPSSASRSRTRAEHKPNNATVKDFTLFKNYCFPFDIFTHMETDFLFMNELLFWVASKRPKFHHTTHFPHK
jgi:hypothetical protein